MFSEAEDAQQREKMTEMNWKGLFMEGPVCQGNEFGLFPSVGQWGASRGF